MFEEKRIETLKKRIEKLEEENKQLKEKNYELSVRTQNMDELIEAAKACIDANKKMKRELGLAKTQYEAIIKELQIMKKDYQDKMDKVIKSI